MGDARLHLFDIPREATELTAMTVELKDGARAVWHSHPRGQILVAISGLGQVQAAGGEVVELRPGDSIWAPPGERHWHGAAASHDFIYTSLHRPGSRNGYREVTVKTTAGPVQLSRPSCAARPRRSRRACSGRT